MLNVVMAAAACIVMLGAACTKAPYDELDAAERTLREAQRAGAPTYVPEQFRTMEAKLQTAKDDIWGQTKVSEFKRDYTRARTLLAEARADGDRIIEEARQRREQAKAAALQEKQQAHAAVETVRDLVERVEQTKAAPRGKPPEQLAAEAKELNRTLAEVQTAIEANNLDEAKQKAKAVQEKSEALQRAVQPVPK